MKSVEFWSSVEYGTFLRGLVRELNKIGWKAEQRYLVEERDYRRIRGRRSTALFRLQSYLLYPLQLFRRVRQPRRPAVLVVCTNTFYAPAVAMLAARKRGVPVIHWVFDLYPDVLVQLGRLRPDGITERFLAQFTRYALRHAAVNVFLGDHVLRRAVERYGEVPRTAVIPIGADGSPFPTAPTPAPTSPILVLYCGNFGRMHDVETVARLIRVGIPEPFYFDFRGKGVGMEKLRQSVPQCSRVTFGPSLAEKEWLVAMRRAPIALVTFKHEASGLGMPSKTYSAMVAGQTILAICPVDSDLGQTVQKHDAGWVVEPGDLGKLRSVLKHIAANPAELEAKRLNAYNAGHAYFDQGAIAEIWAELLDGVVGARVVAEVRSKGLPFEPMPPHALTAHIPPTAMGK